MACGKARGGRIPRSGSVTDEPRSHRPNSAQPERAAVLFRPDFVARSLQIHFGICSSLAPRLAKKSLAAHVSIIKCHSTSPTSAAATATRLSCRTLVVENDWLHHPVSKVPQGRPIIAQRFISTVGSDFAKSRKPRRAGGATEELEMVSRCTRFEDRRASNNFFRPSRDSFLLGPKPSDKFATGFFRLVKL